MNTNKDIDGLGGFKVVIKSKKEWAFKLNQTHDEAKSYFISLYVCVFGGSVCFGILGRSR